VSISAVAVRLEGETAENETKGAVMRAQRKIGVAGATGRVGRHVVDVLHEQGHEVVAISRSHGIDVVTGEGLAEALVGVDVVVDAATGPSPEEEAATAFFTSAARNLQEVGERAGVSRIVAVSIIGSDRFGSGYGAAKVAHERATLSGPVPGLVLRAAQFHEFVQQLVDWGRQGEVAYVPKMRTQLVAARAVAEAAVALTDGSAPAITEVAGPREESLVDAARLLIERKGEQVRIEAVSDTDFGAVFESAALLPGPDATLAGPTFAEWLESTHRAERPRAAWRVPQPRPVRN
jgi:uncharacterized protein YbjT (DUF2867 family)